MDLSEVKNVEVADVYKGVALAGKLHRRRDRTEFTYAPGYLQQRSVAVATTLPLRAEPFVVPAGAVPAFFAGLLPEGRRLNALRARVRTSADDELSLLLAIGSDTVGDVRVLPEGLGPEAIEPLVVVRKSWSEVDFKDLFERSIGTDPDRAGLPGVQEKISGRMIVFPLARRRGQYLLKLNPPEFPHVVENEAFFLRAARRSGLTVPRFEVVGDRNGEKGLLIYRFDRGVDDAGVEVSRAFEDGCQVLGRYPADKYRLGLEEVMAGLSAVTSARPVALLELFRLVVFACVTGNGDLHARNLAVLDTSQREWRIAPAYDVPCTALYGDHTMALPIGGKSREVLSRSQALVLADEIGLARRAAEGVIDKLLRRVAAWMGELDALPFAADRIRELKRFLENRQRLLASH